MTHFAFPYRIAGDGKTADCSADEHIRQLIEQVLFTAQGERVHRPDFGAGVRQLVFSENAPELATAIQHIIQSGLQRWLSELIEVRGVDVAAEGETLSVLVRFRTRDSEAERVVRVVRQA
jgi:phage baseplate assembly protein W